MAPKLSSHNTGWRFQPLWKNMSQIGNHLPQFCGVKIKKIFEIPPPCRYHLTITKILKGAWDLKTWMHPKFGCPLPVDRRPFSQTRPGRSWAFGTSNVWKLDFFFSQDWAYLMGHSGTDPLPTKSGQKFCPNKNWQRFFQEMIRVIQLTPVLAPKLFDWSNLHQQKTSSQIRRLTVLLSHLGLLIHVVSTHTVENTLVKYPWKNLVT